MTTSTKCVLIGAAMALGSSFLYAFVYETGIDSMIATFATLYVPSGHTGGVHGAALVGMFAGVIGGLAGLALVAVGLLGLVGRGAGEASSHLRRRGDGTGGGVDA